MDIGFGVGRASRYYAYFFFDPTSTKHLKKQQKTFMGEQKKRKLRLNDELSSSNAKLLDFDKGHVLLALNQPIILSRDSSSKELRCVTSQEQELQLIKRNPVKFNLLATPIRRQRNCQDPLPDEFYLSFHRRMRKDERSVTLVDKSRLHFDIDNLRGQLALLNQHDWIKHLPSMVILNDRNDYDELVKKRRLAVREIAKTLDKFENWEARTAAHAITVKKFMRGDLGLGDEDDSDGYILRTSLATLAKERAALRMALHGTPVRLVLRNGYDLLAMPHRKPRIVPTGTS